MAKLSTLVAALAILAFSGTVAFAGCAAHQTAQTQTQTAEQTQTPMPTTTKTEEADQ